MKAVITRQTVVRLLAFTLGTQIPNTIVTETLGQAAFTVIGEMISVGTWHANYGVLVRRDQSKLRKTLFALMRVVR